MVFSITSLLILSLSISSIFLFVKDTFTAKASIIVEVKNASSEYQQLILSQNLVSTLKELAYTDVIYNEIRSSLGIEISNSELKDMIRVESITGAIIIDFYVNSNNPSLAKDIAESLVVSLTDFGNSYFISDSIQVLDFPYLPIHPDGPNKVLYIGASVIGALLFSFSIALVSGLVEKKILTKDDVELITDTPIIGSLLNYKYTRNKALTYGNHQIITNLLPESPISEEYYRIKSCIDLSTYSLDQKVISITSPIPGEGKTLIALNLASMYAKAEVKTILLDLNMYKQNISKALKIKSKTGILDSFSNKTIIDEHIKKENDFLDVLTFGDHTDEATDILLSNRFKDLLYYLKTKYDKVIIDTPALSHSHDGMIISLASDLTVLAVRSGVTEFSVLKKSISDLEDYNVNLVGIVLSNVNKYY
jgi:capsular exopolysaccharide synthesis family protein